MRDEQNRISVAENVSRERGANGTCGGLLGGLLWVTTLAYLASSFGTILSFDLSSNLFATLLFFVTPSCGFLAFSIWSLALFAPEKPKFFPFATIANVVITILFAALWCFLRSSLTT